MMEGGRIFYLGRDEVPLHVSLGAGETLFWTIVAPPGVSASVETTIDLDAPGACADIAGVYRCTSTERLSLKVNVRHNAPSCTSRQLFKGIAGGDSKVVFDGLVRVAPGAFGTSAHQESHALLMDDSATVESRPQLEIYADDVECSHGCTTGHLDEDVLFYMRSRGIPEDEAKAMQVDAFLSGVLSRLSVSRDLCCKINLGLEVIRRRPDGFHDLETLFVPCTRFGDRLTVTPLLEEPEDGVDISIDNCDWDPGEDLTVKAWRLLKADYPDLPSVRIELEKRVPVGAGLGGGSADAAAMLEILNEIFSLGLDRPALESYASRLGSDCAFFIHPRPMFGTGRGEVLEPFDTDLDGYEIRVEVPEGVHVSTREAYSGVSPREGNPSFRDTMPLKEALRLPVEEWKNHVVNDFEPSVFRMHPEIEALKERMYADGALYACMSGSGSAVFGIFGKGPREV